MLAVGDGLGVCASFGLVYASVKAFDFGYVDRDPNAEDNDCHVVVLLFCYIPIIAIIS